MKNVLNKSEVAHYWANQIQQQGSVSAKNFYFEGKTIYSYGSHFPIACISDRLGYVLITTRSYSNTTASHISEVKSAASHKELIYCYNPLEALKGNHDENIGKFELTARQISYNLPKSTKPIKYLNRIAEQKAMLMKYVEFFNLKTSLLKKLHYINIVTKEGAIKATEKELKQQAKQQKEAELKRLEHQKQQLEADKLRLSQWRKFQKQYKTEAFIRLSVLEESYLRINKTNQTIETSKDITIPIKIAERYYNWLKKQLTKGGCDENCGYKILKYNVEQVNKEGVIIGCHNVKWDEIDIIATKLKWN